MFWILRRTGAVNFFNSFNNNCGNSKGNNNSTNDKYVKRPPRKAYGRLSADSDDGGSSRIDNAIDNVDNLEMGASNSAGMTNGNNNELPTTNGSCVHNDNAGHQRSRCKDSGSSSCVLNECHGIADGGVCGFGNAGQGGFIENHGAESKQKQKEVNQNTINRLHAMALSDDDDIDEALTCNVCDRAFACYRQLASHQQKKRHFCCGGCDSLFPSLMLLEHHKEEFEHWSDDENGRHICCRRNRSDVYFLTDSDSCTSEAESEDLERLL